MLDLGTRVRITAPDLPAHPRRNQVGSVFWAVACEGESDLYWLRFADGARLPFFGHQLVADRAGAIVWQGGPAFEPAVGCTPQPVAGGVSS